MLSGSKTLLSQFNDFQFFTDEGQINRVPSIKSVPMRKPGRTRQGVIMLKSPISLKLGTNVTYQELTYVTECQVKIYIIIIII